jgi:hypothetical protein
MPWGCVRGVQDYGEGGTVSVPAQTTATMTVAVRTVVPAWPHTDYTPVVTWSGRTVDVPPIRVAGPTGVHIVVRAGTDHLPAGASLTLRGATAPPLRRRVVSLSAAAFTWTDLNAPPRIVLRRRVRTDRSGRFVMRGLRPAISGMYQFRARVVHPGPGLAPDRSCGPVIRVNPGRIGGLP